MLRVLFARVNHLLSWHNGMASQALPLELLPPSPEKAEPKAQPEREAEVKPGQRKQSQGSQAKQPEEEKPEGQPKIVTGGPFGCYMAENRPALIKECACSPELLKQTNSRSGPAALKLGSERFKELDANARAKYDTMYKEKLATYTEKLAAYMSRQQGMT